MKKAYAASILIFILLIIFPSCWAMDKTLSKVSCIGHDSTHLPIKSTCLAMNQPPNNPPSKLAVAPDTKSAVNPCAGAKPDTFARPIDNPCFRKPTQSTIGIFNPAHKKMNLTPLSHIFFQHDDATIDGHGIHLLKKASRYIKSHPDVTRVIINAHTNSLASQKYNIDLGQKRAKRIRSYLAELDVPDNLMTLINDGESSPTDQNWTHLGKNRNRRVEIYVIEMTN